MNGVPYRNPTGTLQELPRLAKKAKRMTEPKRWPKVANSALSTALHSLAEIVRLADSADGYIEIGNRSNVRLALSHIARLAIEARSELAAVKDKDVD
jgi:hypothetical protein